ncbi:MAG: hypothetical protein LBJ74_05970 [Heliobacteriaceae bacterium]|jgi:hypothetical protein|nr:hypothetical protein [Heliobacteriaceae bacterium]
MVNRSIKIIIILLSLLGSTATAFDLEPVPRLDQGTLPPLPKTVPSPQPSAPLAKGGQTASAVGGFYKKGTKFRVKSTGVISDTLKEGSRVYFKGKDGTTFGAVVVNAHPPQFTGNGGLVVLMVETMGSSSAHARITKANHKKIFLNNIKGKRSYLKGVSDSTKPGRIFYDNMRRTTGVLAANKFTMILTPFTAAAGVLVYGVNMAGSPIFAVFSKGGQLSIPAGSEFEVKLLEDIYN